MTSWRTHPHQCHSMHNFCQWLTVAVPSNDNSPGPHSKILHSKKVTGYFRPIIQPVQAARYCVYTIWFSFNQPICLELVQVTLGLQSKILDHNHFHDRITFVSVVLKSTWVFFKKKLNSMGFWVFMGFKLLKWALLDTSTSNKYPTNYKFLSLKLIKYFVVSKTRH